MIQKIWDALNNPDTSAKELMNLATNPNASLRMAVARHLNTPREALELLATDTYPEIRYHVASHPSTPAEVLDVMIDDTDNDVRYRVARNMHTPAEGLDLLTYDPDEEIAETAKYTLRLVNLVKRRVARENKFDPEIAAILACNYSKNQKPT